MHLCPAFQFVSQWIERSPQREAMNRLSRSHRFPTHEHESRSCGSTRERKRFPLPYPPAHAFILCDSISVSPFAPAKSNLPVVSWPARAPSQRIQSGFSQFSKFKEMIPSILSPASETALPSPHLLRDPSRTRTNLRLSLANARWSNFQGKLKNCHEQIGNCTRAPKLVSPIKVPFEIQDFPEDI